MDTIVRKIKFAFYLAVVGAIVMVALPHISKDYTPNPREMPFGPRNPGIDAKFKCRHMSLDVEMTLTKAQQATGMASVKARLDADLGPGRKIVNQIITIPDYSQSRAYYKQEFCSPPGSALFAEVFATVPVQSLACYFYWQPHPDVGAANTEWEQVKNLPTEIETWCKGIVPA